MNVGWFKESIEFELSFITKDFIFERPEAFMLNVFTFFIETLP